MHSSTGRCQQQRRGENKGPWGPWGPSHFQRRDKLSPTPRPSISALCAIDLEAWPWVTRKASNGLLWTYWPKGLIRAASSRARSPHVSHCILRICLKTAYISPALAPLLSHRPSKSHPLLLERLQKEATPTHD
ncbi:hypothetical protein CPAR01_08602 [Colletotrichum paranaense]|uniref:Uncharacterized protein n=1 Tax=Colletotrichum paranaense TaxID=1914294 RepID=A0ABQ9SKQ6_9PEZI|nr:uncharacterized protein CPAR01_08602 [Colletotrichum paranaense]KAK1538489.1 hypothetical protein CPAR01_08602 [Colletotrichum paranaense]